MFRKILLVGLFSLLSGVALAQTAPMQDVVYLKNGSVIRGVIIEQVPNESLKIETRDGNVFVYRMEEITKMTKEQAPNYYGVRPRYEAKARGYMGIVEAGYGIGVGGGSTIGMRYTDRFELDVINGYQFSPYGFIGVGVGFNISTNGENVMSIPLFLHGRVNLIDRNFSPFIALSLGYNISTSPKEKIDYNTYAKWSGGVMVEPTLGMTIRVSNKAAVTFGVGFSILQFKGIPEGYYAHDYRITSLNTKAIRLKVGATF